MFTGDNVCAVLLMKVIHAASLEEWLPGAKRTLALCSEYTPWGGHADGRESAEQIEKIIGYVEEILEKYPKTKRAKKSPIPPFPPRAV